MGGGNVKTCSLKKSELKEFHNMSYFSDELIITLHNQYSLFSSLLKDDGVISYEEFLILIGREDNQLSQKIFDAVDINKDKRINFREFLKMISCFITGSREDQISLSFKFFADEDSNLISRDLFFTVLKDAVMQENYLIQCFDDECLVELIDNTFNMIEYGDGGIDYEAFKSILIKNPEILKWFKIDINKIKQFSNKIIKTSYCS